MKRILIALIGASTLGGVLLSVLPKRASNPEPMVELKESLQKA